MAGFIIIAPIDICARITAKSLIRYIKYPIKCNTDIPNIIRNAKNLIYPIPKITYSHIYTVAVARCHAQCLAIFFYALKDIEKRLAAATSIYRFAAKSILLRNIIKSALRNLLKVP